MSMPLVLVTGATGFLGSHITEVLVTQGYQVRCTLRPSSSSKWLDHLNIEKVTVDFKDVSSLQAACAGVDIVIHNAGITRTKSDAEFFAVNTNATERLAQAALKAKVSRFIFISSLEARGPDGFNKPLSAYGKSKLEAEQRLAKHNEAMDIMLLRPAGVYGPRDSDSLTLFQMAQRGFLAVPATSGRVQPVHARDVAEAVVATLNQNAKVGPFEIAETTTYSWQDMAQFLGLAMKRQLRVIRLPKEVFLGAGYLSEGFGKLFNQEPQLDRRRAKSLAYYTYTCNTNPFKEAFGWQARISLQDGLAETAQWYKQHKWL
jgi:nucleoside-diphosphate-sugar epimerase